MWLNRVISLHTSSPFSINDRNSHLIQDFWGRSALSLINGPGHSFHRLVLSYFINSLFAWTLLRHSHFFFNSRPDWSSLFPSSWLLLYVHNLLFIYRWYTYTLVDVFKVDPNARKWRRETSRVQTIVSCAKVAVVSSLWHTLPWYVLTYHEGAMRRSMSRIDQSAISRPATVQSKTALVWRLWSRLWTLCELWITRRQISGPRVWLGLTLRRGLINVLTGGEWWLTVLTPT